MGIAFSNNTTNANTPRRTITHPPPYPPPYHPLDYYSYYTPSPQPSVYYPSFYGSNGYSVCSHEIGGGGGGGGGGAGAGVVGQPCFGNLVVGQPRMTVDEQKMAKVVNSDVNVHKDSLRLEVDELNPDRYLVSFVFDALLDGSITICYFAKEDANRRVVPLFPDTYVPIKVPFRKGLHQEFRQPSGTGIDFTYFSLEALSNSSSRDDVFPIVISADTFSPYMYHDRSYLMAHSMPQMQITQVVVTNNNEEQYAAKAIRQLLWVDDTCYELREIYGLGKSGSGVNDGGSGKECVICMSEPKDIAVLPCRHMCMCSECAKALRLQSNKCPICREIIEALLEIKIESMDQ